MDSKINLLRTEHSNFLGATPDGFGDFVHVLLQLPTGSSWIRNRWVLWVPRLLFCSNCVLQERTVTPTRDMGLRYEHHWFLFCLSSRSSSSSRAQEGILAIMLVVGKGNLLCKGMTVIVEGLLRLRPVTTVIASRNSKLRPPHSNASTRGDAAAHLN